MIDVKTLYYLLRTHNVSKGEMPTFEELREMVTAAELPAQFMPAPVEVQRINLEFAGKGLCFTIDPNVPEGEIRFMHGGKVVGRIIDAGVRQAKNVKT